MRRVGRSAAVSNGGDVKIVPGRGEPGGAIRLFTSRGREAVCIENDRVRFAGLAPTWTCGACVHGMGLDEPCDECPNESLHIETSRESDDLGKLRARIEELEADVAAMKAKLAVVE